MEQYKTECFDLTVAFFAWYELTLLSRPWSYSHNHISGKNKPSKIHDLATWPLQRTEL